MHKREVKIRNQWRGRGREISRGLLPFALSLLTGSALAQDASRIMSPPPELPAQPPEAGKRVGREVRYDLALEMVNGSIFNPATGEHDQVLLRSYTALDESQRPHPASRKFIAPLINMKPGQTVRITLHNRLDVEKQKCRNHENVPTCFNTTNLHTHGLWVSPAGNSDNVLLEIQPRTTFQYEYNVPEDHPAGTFWYHPHVHGSTAVQVGSGMAGALIIRGDRTPVVTSHDGQVRLQAPGDLDVLLKPFEPTPGTNDYPEVLLFQQIPYACFKTDDKGNKTLKTENPSATNPGRWACGKDETGKADVGEVSDFGAQMGAGKWRASGRYTSINGFVQPTINMKAKQLYRWRLIDAGIHESIGLTITKLKPSVQWPTKLTPTSEMDFIEKHCKQGAVVTQFEVATDGLTREQIVSRDATMLQPGYRSDILFAFPSQGEYCLYDAASRTSLVANDTSPEGPKLLGRVVVKSGDSLKGDVMQFIKDELKRAARKAFTGDVQKMVVNDLSELKTTAFVPHRSFSKVELETMSENCTTNEPPDRKPECVTLNITTKAPFEFQVDEKPFGQGVTRTLLLGNSQKWVLQSTRGNHPFHIHVNPFQVLKILKPKKDSSDEYEEIDYTSPDESEYSGVKGAWKDTVLIKQGYKVITGSRYERYIGEFVLHCHLLDHEDQGMMQTVQIVHTDSNGKPVAPGHQAPSAHQHH